MSPLEALSQSFLMPFPLARAATHSPSQGTITANVGKLFAISGHCLSCYTSVYICYMYLYVSTELHPKCGVRQVAML